jgi:ribonuclease D
MKNPTYTYVDNYNLLKNITSQIGEASELGVDLEADSMFHYREKICILQISSRKANYIIDTIAIRDVSLLKKVFADRSIKKIFHGADYDVRLLKRDYNIKIEGLFDTQIAARFLGINETGLGSLLWKRLGIKVEKKYQKKDWSQRPLNEKMISYAVNDSCHLIPLARDLKVKLFSLGRLSYAEEECEVLSKAKYPIKKNGPMFLNFKGAGSLDPRRLALLEELLIYRESLARNFDKPPFKVMGNGAILTIVKERPKSIDDLRSIKALSARQIERFGSSILSRIDKAIKIRDNMLPSYPENKRKRFSKTASERIKSLKQWRVEKASQLGIDPPLIFSNAAIKPLALIRPSSQEALRDIPELREWQIKEFGNEICALIN